MKKLRISLLIIISSLLLTSLVYAREGDSGYEGSISSPGTVNNAYECQEVVFITGEPIVFKGTLTIKKSQKQGSMTTTYTYNLKNVDKTGTLTRNLVYNTTLTNEYNKQISEQTSLGNKFSESIKIGSNTYTLKSYDFTRSNLIDPKPAVNYYAGNVYGRKIYQIGTAASGGNITVDTTGKFYGFDQYWGTSEVINLNHTIKYEAKKDTGVEKWGGTATVSLSSNTSKELRYFENQPSQISFSGGYVQVENNNSILQYKSLMPEFDKNGVSTDKTISKGNSLKLEKFTTLKSLPTPDLRQIKGHWAENDIRTVYSLGIYKDESKLLNPEQYISRAEFTYAMAEAAKEVPLDPALTKTSSTKKNTTKQVESPFVDLSTDNIYFDNIYNAYERGIVFGRGTDNFKPDENLTVAESIAIFIRALGLEQMAPAPNAVTTFKDNDLIPAYARNAVYAAQQIGLIRGDTKGFLNPNDNITKARAATMINRFIEYMRSGIKKDYEERIVNYN